MSDIQSFHVFLSYNSKNKPAVVELAKRLKARGLKMWLDARELPPGRPWQEALEDIIATTRAAVVLVGADGLGPWHKLEMRGCLSRFVNRGLPVIPVLLPGCPIEPDLPLFMEELTWVDLREDADGEGFLRLLWGITGEKPKELHEAHGAMQVKAEPPFIIDCGTFEPFIHGWPADKVQALQRQAAEALGLPVFFRHKLKSGGEGPEMVVIPAGAFEMGLNDGRGHEKPVHRVDVPGFAIGRLPITVAEYSKFRMVPDDNEDDARPVVNVTWEEAREYCAWLSRETDQAYRLPSEAEWEYACRAGAAGRWYWGDDSGAMDRYAWYRGNSEGKTHPVGEKQPNAFGLHDMLGNVWEWCEDAWHDDYRGSPANGGAWSKGSEAGYRINRGGSSGDSAWVVCCAERGAEFFNLRFDYRGFRVVLAEILPGVS